MNATSWRRAVRLITAVVAGGVAIAGCASGSNAAIDASAVTAGIVGSQSAGGSPQSGGTLAFATYNPVTTLDPADRQDGGSTGGSEMAAIYDVLMRYDTVTEEYLPQLAESMTGDADGAVWTLKLRGGATFSDGTPVDGASVTWSIDRYLQKQGAQTQVWKASVEKMDVPDPSTVVFTLKQPWSDFPALMNTGPGMVVAPSSTAAGDFAPIGAGPFTVERFSPHDELVLKARGDYVGGKPYLDSLRFPAIVSEEGKLDALHAGGIQAAYLRNSEVVERALTAGNHGYIFSVNMGGVGLINQREGRAGADVRVRKAIVAAIDPVSFNERVEGGFGMVGSAMFQSWSMWSSDAATSLYDPDSAKKHLAEAMADGYDGKLTYVGMNDPATQQTALAFQQMLQAVGFDVEISYTNNISDLIKRMYAQHDFDVGYSGFNVLDAVPFVKLYANLYSGSTSNVLGYESAAMDELLAELQSAQSTDDKIDVLGRMQTHINDTAPWVNISAGKYFIPWASNVHGVTPSLDGIMLFDKAWTAQV